MMMTEPLAHFAMLLENTVCAIEQLNIERIRIDAKLSVLNEQRYAIAKALDEERAKVKP